MKTNRSSLGGWFPFSQADGSALKGNLSLLLLERLCAEVLRAARNKAKETLNLPLWDFYFLRCKGNAGTPELPELLFSTQSGSVALGRLLIKCCTNVTCLRRLVGNPPGQERISGDTLQSLGAMK